MRVRRGYAPYPAALRLLASLAWPCGHRSEQALPALLPRFTPVWPVITSLISSPSCTVTHTFGLRGLSRHKRFPPYGLPPIYSTVPHALLLPLFHADFYGERTQRGDGFNHTKEKEREHSKIKTTIRLRI